MISADITSKPSRRRVLAAGVSLALAGGVARCAPADDGGTGSSSGLTFVDFNISPDGETIVYEVAEIDKPLPSGIGLFRWRSGEIRPIPNPPNARYSGASFSPDGTKLCAVKLFHEQGKLFSTLVELEIETLQDRNVAPPLPAVAYSYPIYDPSGSRILFGLTQYPYPTTLNLLDLATGHRTELLSWEKGFLSIFRSSFLSDLSILFPALGPHDKEMQSQLGTGLGGEYTYRLQIGGIPELMFPELEAPLARAGAGYVSLSCSHNGKEIIGLGLNLAQPLGASNQYNYEVFRLRGGEPPEQLSDLKGFLGLCRVAFGGSMACFGSRDSRNGSVELNVLEISRREVTQTRLREQLTNSMGYLP